MCVCVCVCVCVFVCVCTWVCRARQGRVAWNGLDRAIAHQFVGVVIKIVDCKYL